LDYCLHERDAETERADGVETRRLFDRTRGCETFSQRLLRFARGAAGERVDAASDELLYVLDGSGRLTVGGAEHAAARGTCAAVPAGTPWSAEADGELLVLSVLVHDPEPDAEPNVLDVGGGDAQVATAGREFTLGAECPSVTQFVGVIPPGRAPDHFHRYDEVVYVLEGNGTLHIGGETAELRPGASVHLPARLVHSLENGGDGEMLVLGVFRPAGSPAEAYYPDGTLAVVPER
jgi:quercetin dioxygenase-like cupin family protein